MTTTSAPRLVGLFRALLFADAALALLWWVAGLRSVPLLVLGAVAALLLERALFTGLVGRVRRGLLAARALARLTPTPGAEAPPRREACHLPSRVPYDLYAPPGAVRRTLVAVHGVSVNGARDARLVRFAGVFSDAGFRVAVPDLAGLRSFREDPADVDALRELYAGLHRPGDPPLAVVGFSFGGGLALTAASDPLPAVPIDPILLLGAPHDVRGLLGQYVPSDTAERPDPPDGDDRAWDDLLYFRLLQAHRWGEAMGLSEAERTEVAERLAGYCAASDVAAKRRFYDEVIRPRELGFAPDDEQRYDDAALAALSPAGRLGPLPATVLLLHDPADGVIPPDHTHRLFDELASRQPPRRQRRLVTPLLTHVAPGDLWRVHDGVRLLGFFGELFRVPRLDPPETSD